MQQIKENLIEIYNIIRKPQMRILPGQLAFFFILSLIPIITVIFDLAGILSISIESINQYAMLYLPNEISDIILSVTKSDKGFSIDTAILFCTAFFLASNGTYSIIMTSNFLHETKEYTYIKNRIKAVILTFLIIFALLFTIFVLAFGRNIIVGLQSIELLEFVSVPLLLVFDALKFPIGYLIIFVTIKLVYIIAPEKKIESKSVNYGAIFTTLLWLVATFIFTIYVNQFANYGMFYGPLSNIIALMIWIYILAYIFVLGMSINIGIELKKKSKPIDQDIKG